MKANRMTTRTGRRLRAFLAAPAQEELETLSKELAKRDVAVFTAYDLPLGANSLVADIRRAIEESDLTVGVIPEKASPNVFFELGMAHALNKPGWRIYEGGGGVKGKKLMVCFEWRSEQAPSDGAGGMRAQPQFSLGDGTPLPFLVLSERELTHLSGLVDQDVDSQPGVS